MAVQNRSGNVLFLILIAVALFAALSYAVTGSSRSSGAQISADQARILAAEIRQYASSIEQAITKLSVINGCGDNEISFDNPVTQGYADIDLANPRSPSDFSCHVFHPNGGGLAYRTWDDKFLGDTGNASYLPVKGYSLFMARLQVLDHGTEKAEMLFVVPWLKPEICNALNKSVSDIENMRVSINTNGSSNYIGPSALYDAGDGAFVIYVGSGWESSPFHSGCGIRSSTPGAEYGGHTYYYTLKSR